MRTDVKLGFVVGLAILSGMTWWMLRRESPKAIPLADAGAGQKASEEADSGTTALPPPLFNPPVDRTKTPLLSAKPPEDRPRRTPAKETRPPLEHSLTTRPVASRPKPKTTMPSMLAQAGANQPLDLGEKAPSADRPAKPPLVAPPGRELTPSIKPQPTPVQDDAKKKGPLDAPRTGAKRPPILPDMGDRTESAKLPGPTSKPKPEPEPKERIHEVKKYDTFAILAEQYYGSQRYAGLLAKANPQVKDPRAMKVGTKLRIPSKAELLKPPTDADKGAKDKAEPAESSRKDTKEPPAAPPTKEEPKPAKEPAPKPKIYIVKENDSFYAITERIWGDGTRWKELQNLNKDICPDPYALRPGMKLRIDQPKTRPAKKGSSGR